MGVCDGDMGRTEGEGQYGRDSREKVMEIWNMTSSMGEFVELACVLP